MSDPNETEQGQQPPEQEPPPPAAADPVVRVGGRSSPTVQLGGPVKTRVVKNTPDDVTQPEAADSDESEKDAG